MSQPMADINDVFAWVDAGGAKLNLAMTVSPFDDGSHHFGSSVQYVWHLTRNETLPTTLATIAAGEESKVICTFASDTDGQCWVVDPAGKLLDYVKGDFSASTGKASAGGMLKVFAGRRSDPFFFNLGGFVLARTALEGSCGTNMPCPGLIPTYATPGCPKISGAQAAPLYGLVTNPPAADVANTPCKAGQADCFATANVMAIAVQVDKSLIVTDDKQILGVWGSTHAAQ
jgi:hypothetical protein